MLAGIAELDPDRVFAVETTRSAGSCVLTVTGDVDAVSAPALRRLLLEALGEPDATDVLLDLRRVTFLDSAGLTALVVADRTARDTGRTLRLRCGTARAVRRPLDITGLVAVLTISDPWSS